MKKIFAVVTIVALFTAGCKKASVNLCASPSNFAVQSQGVGDIQVTANGSGGFMQVEYGANGYTRGTGTSVNLNAYGGSITALNNGTYDVYLRANCGGSSYSDWVGPKSVLVTGGGNVGSCSSPANLDFTITSSRIDLMWFYTSSSNTLFELQYDTAGFVSTQAQTIRVNGSSGGDYTGGSFIGGHTYEFMVRVQCVDGSWSAWSPRKSLYVANTVYGTGTCHAPGFANKSAYLTNVSGANIGATMTWDGSGSNTYEYGLSSSNTPPTSVTSTTQLNANLYFSSGQVYYFYVRGVCQDGSKTAWYSVAVSI